MGGPGGRGNGNGKRYGIHCTSLPEKLFDARFLSKNKVIPKYRFFLAHINTYKFSKERRKKKTSPQNCPSFLSVQKIRAEANFRMSLLLLVTQFDPTQVHIFFLSRLGVVVNVKQHAGKMTKRNCVAPPHPLRCQPFALLRNLIWWGKTMNGD